MSKRAIMLHYDSIEQLELLNDEERGRVLLDLLKYARDGQVPEYSEPSMKMMFSILKQRTDAEAQKYEEICKKRSQAGIKGNAVRYGHEDDEPRKRSQNSQNVASVANASKCSQVSQKVANLANNKNNNSDIYSSNEEHISITLSNEREEGGGKMKRPTLEQIKQYMQEKGYYRFSAEEWLAHYESNGWRVGRNPMKKWQDALKTWEYSRKKKEEDAAKKENERRNSDVNAYWE